MFSIILKWHKTIGVCTAIFIIFLAMSGIVLNHSEQFNLNSRFIQTEWLLDLYQIKPASDPVAFNSENNWAVQIGERLYFNEQEIGKDIKQLKGMIKVNGLFIVAYDDKLTLVTDQGEIVETLSGEAGVPAGMRGVGYDENGNIIIKAAHGYYQVNLDDLKWQEFEYLLATWPQSLTVPDELKTVLYKKYRGTGLSIERVLLDFHSGRILGHSGVYLVDFFAFLFVSLAISGVWMWTKLR